jgi:alkanesulfonate monooxygenase SsuD/methylene tetrahydromethanopterin reductase-like flavin-dependent oxidoreductase (luciferase family)
MRFAISIPQFYADGEFDPAAFRDYFTRAESFGCYESAWAQEMTLGASAQLSPIEAMTYAAAVSRGLRLGCTVFVSTLHTPAHLAKSLATLDQMSGGRLEIGVGTGGPNRPFAAFGVDGSRYVARFTEGVRLMQALWTQQRVTFEGEFWQLKDAAMEPKPLQKPYPRLWFGASGESALRRAVRLGGGFFGAGSSTTAAFASQVLTVREALAAAGRPASEFPIAKRLYVAIDSTADRARQRMNTELEKLYGRRVPSIEEAAVAGTVADIVSAVHAAASAGAERILFTPLHEVRDHMEQIAVEVIPRLDLPAA